jgi:hypothetical protein
MNPLILRLLISGISLLFLSACYHHRHAYYPPGDGYNSGYGAAPGGNYRDYHRNGNDSYPYRQDDGHHHDYYRGYR